VGNNPNCQKASTVSYSTPGRKEKAADRMAFVSGF
jgi:hypothetical protein